MNKIKLDLKDRKILALLDENSRYTNSQIAKKVQLSKPAVEYRIQRLIKQVFTLKYSSRNMKRAYMDLIFTSLCMLYKYK